MTYQTQHRGEAEGSVILTDPEPGSVTHPTIDLDGVPDQMDPWSVDGSGSFEEWAARLRVVNEDGTEAWPPSGEVEATVTEFEPLDGERLEHLASRRKGPLRWAAGLILTMQAQRLRSGDAVGTAHDPASGRSSSGEGDAATPPGGLHRRRRTPAQLRRSALRQGGRPDLRPVETVIDLTTDLMDLVRDELGTAVPGGSYPGMASGLLPVIAEPLDPSEGPDVEELERWLGFAGDEADDSEEEPPAAEVASDQPVDELPAPELPAARSGHTRAGRVPRRAGRSRVPRPASRRLGGTGAEDVDADATPPAGVAVPATEVAPAPVPAVAVASTTADPDPTVDGQAAADPDITVHHDSPADEPMTGPRPVAPISGWVGTDEDEQAWLTWISDPVSTDQDGQLAALGADLARPLPTAVRLAQRLGRRRRPDPRPMED